MDLRPHDRGIRAPQRARRPVARNDRRDDGRLAVLSRRRVVVERTLDVGVDLHPDRPAHLLGEMAQQTGGAREQREATQDLGRKTEVREYGAAHAGAVEWKRSAEHFAVHATDGLEQLEVWPTHALLTGDG